MKKIYESFIEIAREFTTGENVTHVFSTHTVEECTGWQHGVHEFAKFLDAAGLKMIANPEIHDELWEKVSGYSPPEETIKAWEHSRKVWQEAKDEHERLGLDKWLRE